jgi:hypothetical protein
VEESPVVEEEKKVYSLPVNTIQESKSGRSKKNTNETKNK